MAEPGPERPPPTDLKAAIAALPAKKEAVREAFDRLAACSPYPLPFTWEGLDAHISSIQSSISRCYRQLQVLEAVRPPRTGSVPAEMTSGENQQQKEEEEEEEEEEEVEVEVGEEEEENDDGEDDEGEEKEEEDGEEEEVEEEVVEEEEIEEEVDEEEIEEEEIEEEVLEEAEDDTIDEEKKEADKEMQLTSKEDRNVKEEPMVSGKVEEQNADEEMMPKKDDEAKEETGKVVHEEDKEEQEAEEEEEPPNVEPGAKNAAILPKEKTQKKVQRAPASWHKDLMAACASMDANMLLKFICCNRTALGKVLPIAMRHASDAAALAVQVVKLFLSSKKFKGTKVWNKCISLIQYVPVATPKPSAATIEQAKQVAKDWKEMIYKLECPGDLELLVWSRVTSRRRTPWSFARVLGLLIGSRLD
ncbi:hypothetical protein QOZ80_3BG0272250 [Eleusine coracana subsp. coracana]|nr:hypothetical protein QOZ80_3BG0272250 [Eleusine coracana subsp. coracana]